MRRTSEMCGRYTLTAPGEIVAEIFELVHVAPHLPNGVEAPPPARSAAPRHPRTRPAGRAPPTRAAAGPQSPPAPAPAAGWQTTPVSRAVNPADHDAPDCIEPLVAGS